MRFAGKPRRALVAAVAAALMALAGCTSASHPQTVPPPRGEDHRPNIVFVLTDDLSTDLVRYMPHVLALQGLGTTFSNYFVVDSLCCPSRSSIFTGQYPHNDGVYTNSGADGGYRSYNAHQDALRSFAVALQKAGYRTALMGKYLNGYQVSDLPAQGWTEWDVGDVGYPEFNYSLNQDGSRHSYGHKPSDYLTDVLSRKGAAFIDASVSAGRPFALEVATFAPHRPATPAPQDRATFTGLPAPRGPNFDRVPKNAPPWLASRRLSARDVGHIDTAYDKRVESVQAVDRMIGHLERVLRARRQLSNTYFVFSSDNGFHMGQYALRPGKETAFDTDIRVPLVVAGPGVPRGATAKALTSSVDLAPTFTEIAGIRNFDSADGTSMLPLWHGARAAASWRQAVLIEHHHTGPRQAGPDQQPLTAGNPPSYEALRTAHALYVEYADGSREYYDLTTDPLEMDNRARSLHPAQLARLHRELRALAACRGAAACGAAARPA